VNAKDFLYLVKPLAGIALMYILFAVAGQISWLLCLGFIGFFLALTTAATGVRQHQVTRQKRDAELSARQCTECGVYAKLHGRVCADCSDSHVLEKTRALVYDAEGMPEYAPTAGPPLTGASPAHQLAYLSDKYGLPVATPAQKEFTREEEARYRNVHPHHGLTEADLAEYRQERDAVADAASAVQGYVPAAAEEMWALLSKKLKTQAAAVVTEHGDGQLAHWEVHPKWVADVEHVRPGSSAESLLYGYPLHVDSAYGVPELVLDPEPPEPEGADPGRTRIIPPVYPEWSVLPTTGQRPDPNELIQEVVNLAKLKAVKGKGDEALRELHRNGFISTEALREALGRKEQLSYFEDKKNGYRK
jgi:hypothetical protein